MCTVTSYTLNMVLKVAWWWLLRVETCRCKAQLMLYVVLWVEFYKYLINYKIPLKTQHLISIMLYSDMFRLARVIIRLYLTIFKVCKLTVHIWDPKGLKRILLFFFCIPCSVHRDSILIRSNKMQQYAGIYLLQIYSTCFGCPSHPSSGVHETVYCSLRYRS